MGISLSRLWPSPSPVRCIESACDSHGGTLPPKPDAICEGCWTSLLAVGLCDDWIQPIITNGVYCRYKGGRSCYMLRSHLKRSPLDCQCCILVQEALWRADLLESGSARTSKGQGDEFREDGSTSTVDELFKIAVGFFGPNDIDTVSPPNAQVLGVVINQKLVFVGVVHTFQDDPAAPYIVARDPLLDVGALSTLSLAKELIQECVQGHGRCIQISPSCTDVDLPTRLVDCAGDLSRPRLVRTKGQRGRYLTLSYVWGEERVPHQTTLSNVSVYADPGILEVSLPQTLRDAIYVTRSLGFHYLWVDSLCIIQDSEQDKLSEIGRMHTIYRNAFLTIVAASAENVNDGFLQVRSPVPARDGSRQVTLPFVCPPEHGGVGVADVQRIGQVRVTSAPFDPEGRSIAFSRSDSDEPTNKRGWCLQELVLSPRALIFTSETVRFRCQEATRNVGNSFCNQMDDIRVPDPVLFLHGRPASELEVRRPTSEVQRILRLTWANLVLAYTYRTLRDPSDKLTAFSAVAEAYSHVMHSDYLAGIWRRPGSKHNNTLLPELLWTAMAPVSLPAIYRAPSWSWAAVDGPILLRAWPCGIPSSATAVAEVVDCQVTLENPEETPFGRVKDGFLVLRVALIRPEGTLRFGRMEGDRTRFCPTNRERPSLSDLASLLSPARKHLSPAEIASGEPMLEDNSDLRGWCDMDTTADRETYRKSDAEVWFVPLLCDEFHGDVYGLIVTLAASASTIGTEGQASYRRVGSFHADGESWNKRYWWPMDDDRVEIKIV